MLSPTDGDRFGLGISSGPLMSPDQRSCGITNGRDYLGLYPSPIFSLSPADVSPSPPAASSFDDDSPISADAGTANQLYISRLTLQYREIAERLALCLSHFEDAAEEAETLRRENAELRLVQADLHKRLDLLSGVGKHTTSWDASIADELRRLRLAGDRPAPLTSPRSVLGMQENRSPPPAAAAVGIPLPKSISVRSSGYLKLNPAGGGGTPLSSRNSRLRVSTPVTVPKRVYVGSSGGGGSGGNEASAGDAAAEALELEVYNQGMFKTELCNKWEETGECPYGDHCQFAHGIGELRPVIRHPRYKTELCRMVLAGETCPYGHRCHFRHAISPEDHILRHPSY